jgi:hypothetical protein
MISAFEFVRLYLKMTFKIYHSKLLMAMGKNNYHFLNNVKNGD